MELTHIHLARQISGCLGVSVAGNNVYRVDLPGNTNRLATQAEIDAANAAINAETADLATYQAERTDLQSQLQTAAARLTQIKDATSMTNVQAVDAIKDTATIVLRLLKYVRRL